MDDTALGEVAQPQDVANVIAFLASGEARHATGATIDVNSGELRPLSPAGARPRSRRAPSSPSSG